MSSLVQSPDYESTCNVGVKVSGSLVQQFHHSHQPIITTNTNTNTNTNTYIPKLIIKLLMRIKHAHWFNNNNTIHKLTIPFLNQKQIIQSYTLSKFVNDNSIVTHSLSISLSGALVGPLLSHAERQDMVSEIVTSIRSKIPSTETMVLSDNPDIVFEVEITILRSWFCNVDDQKNNETTMEEEEKQDAGDQVHGENCVICFDQLGLEKGVYLPCGHKLFHKWCISQWFITNDTCPLCRHMLLSRRF